MKKGSSLRGATCSAPLCTLGAGAGAGLLAPPQPHSNTTTTPRSLPRRMGRGLALEAVVVEQVLELAVDEVFAQPELAQAVLVLALVSALRSAMGEDLGAHLVR